MCLPLLFNVVSLPRRSAVGLLARKLSNLFPSGLKFTLKKNRNLCEKERERGGGEEKGGVSRPILRIFTLAPQIAAFVVPFSSHRPQIQVSPGRCFCSSAHLTLPPPFPPRRGLFNPSAIRLPRRELGVHCTPDAVSASQLTGNTLIYVRAKIII